MVESEKSFVQFVHAKIGASPGWGGARRLTQIVGRKEALRLCAASIPIRAKEAVNVGFVDGTVPSSTGTASPSTDEEHLSAGVAFLQPYLAQPFPGSVRAIKTTIAAVEHCGVEESRQVELDMFESRWFGPDNQSALSKK